MLSNFLNSNMGIKHHFIKEQSSKNLFKDTENFEDFKKKLKELSVLLPVSNPKRWGRKLNREDNINLILGDGFELFCELFILHMGFHPHIGLAKYYPVPPEEDNGIDAFAYNLKNELSAIQCKFVSNVNFEFIINGSNISNLLTQATQKNISWEEDIIVKRLFLITTCKGLHYSAVEKWNDSVKVINGKIIKSLVDNNIIFWESCLKKVEEKSG